MSNAFIIINQLDEGNLPMKQKLSKLK